MGREIWRYNVCDIVSNQTVIKNGNRKDVAAAIGINPDKITSYSKTKNLFQKRYRITEIPIPADQIKADQVSDTETFTKMPVNWQTEWNDICPRIKAAIEDGAVIVGDGLHIRLVFGVRKGVAHNGRN